VGAKVNGRIVPLSYTLKSGDRIEVLTSNQLDKGPSRDWAKIVQTKPGQVEDPPVLCQGEARGLRAARP